MSNNTTTLTQPEGERNNWIANFTSKRRHQYRTTGTACWPRKGNHDTSSTSSHTDNNDSDSDNHDRETQQERKKGAMVRFESPGGTRQPAETNSFMTINGLSPGKPGQLQLSPSRRRHMDKTIGRTGKGADDKTYDQVQADGSIAAIVHDIVSSPMSERHPIDSAILERVPSVEPPNPTLTGPIQDEAGLASERNSDVGNTRVGNDTDLNMHNHPSCDYDKNPTVLYKLLESSSWDEAVERCRSHEEEVRTWVERHDKANQQVVRWKLLPLHAAIIFQSPFRLLKLLLETFYPSASRTDDQGMLPLHLAFRHKHDDEKFLEYLLVKYPKAVSVRDRKGRVPLEHGKEGSYSAKFMSLYSDTVITASSSEIGLGKEKIVTEQIQEYETKLCDAATAHAGEMATLKSLFEERIAMLNEQHRVELEKMRLESDAVHQKLEIELRRSSPARASQSGALLYGKLRDQNQTLQSELTQVRSEYDIMETMYRTVQTVHERTLGGVNEMADDLLQLQALVATQQEELEAAQAMRAQLLRTLTQQDQDEKTNRAAGSNQITTLGERIRSKLHEVMSKTVTPGRAMSPTAAVGTQAIASTLSAITGTTGRQAGISRPTTARPTTAITPKHMRESSVQGTYLETARQADDISAITEQSNY